jgi:hypothetical protein
MKSSNPYRNHWNDTNKCLNMGDALEKALLGDFENSRKRNFERNLIIDTSSLEPSMICVAAAPYHIVLGNKAWTQFTLYEQHEVEGKAFDFLQSKKLDLKQVNSKSII